MAAGVVCGRAFGLGIGAAAVFVLLLGAALFYCALRASELTGLPKGQALAAAFRRPAAFVRAAASPALGAAVLAAAAFLFGFMRCAMLEAYVSPLEDRAGSVVSVSGSVVRARQRDGYIELTVKAEEAFTAGGEAIATGEKLLVRAYRELADDFEACSLAGLRVRFSGELSLPDGVRNPGDFDYRLYLKGRDIRAICAVNAYRFSAEGTADHFLHFLGVLKSGFLRLAARYLGEKEFALCAGLLFGEKGFLDSETYKWFKDAGTAHILAVSGLHAGLLYALILRLLGGRRNLKSSLLIAASLLVYAALADFSVSVLRASLMIALSLLAFHLKRRYDMVCAASLTAMIFMAANPYHLYEAGFQLSFMAAYTIGVALPWAELKLKQAADARRSEALYRVGSILLPCIMLQLGMAPLMLYHYTLFSPLAVILNPAAVFLAGLLLPAGLAFFGLYAGPGAVLACRPPAAGVWARALLTRILYPSAAGVCGGLADVLIMVSKAAEAAGGGLRLPAPGPDLLALYYAAFFWFFSETRHILHRRGRKRALALIAAAVISVYYIVPGLPAYTFTFVDVGQGDCMHLQTDGCNVLIDGGGSRSKNVGGDTLYPYLLKNGIAAIDLAFVSHLDTDHCKGIEELSQCIHIGTIAFPAGCEGEDLSGYRADNIIFLAAGDRLNFGPADFTVLSPSASALTGDKNEDSLILRLEYNGVSFLLTGDLSFDGESALLSGAADAGFASAALLDADILKLGHHGSAYSTSPEFAAAVSPAFAAISCGRGNSYGHPAGRILDLLESSGIPYMRTDLSGAICITIGRTGSLKINNAAKDVVYR